MSKTKKPWEVGGIEWREVRLGDLIDLKYGKGLPKRIRKPGNIPVYGSNGVIGYHDKSLTKAPTIIVGRKGSAGETWLSFVPCWVIDTAFYVELEENQLDWKYLYQYTKVIRKHLVFPKGVKPGINRRDYLNLKIPIPFRNGKPDLETQKKIVEYIEVNFSRIDKILEKKKKELEKLDELWESVLEQAFKPKEGEEWREIKFLDKINLVKGTKPKSSVKEERENTLPYLTTEYFREKIIKEYIPIEKNKITLVNDGDLVIIADGSRSGELFFCDMKGVLVSTMAKFEFNESDINKKYLFWFLTTHFEHLNKSKYTATPHVNKNHLKTLKIPLPFRNNQPDIEKQKEIANYLDSVYEKIKTLKEKIQNQITQLEEMKESILDEVFNHDETK